MTSHDVVAVVRRRFQTRAVGHTGTLDPFATGLLVLVLGGATRLARFVEAGTKTYRAVAALGRRTATDDLAGEPLGEAWIGAWPSHSAVSSALASLTGRQSQRPPAFSAKHVAGERSHKLARQGVLVDLPPVPVWVESIELERYDPPMVGFLATVGPGAYVRSLARDLGDQLGTGAHLVELRRERVGPFDVARAVTPDRLTGAEPLIPPVDLVGELRRVGIRPDEVKAVRHGRAIDAESAPIEGLAALLDGPTLVAIAEAQNGKWQPIVVQNAD